MIRKFMLVRMCWLSVWTMHQFVRLYGRVCERVCVEYACVCIYTVYMLCYSSLVYILTRAVRRKPLVLTARECSHPLSPFSSVYRSMGTLDYYHYPERDGSFLT